MLPRTPRPRFDARAPAAPGALAQLHTLPARQAARGASCCVLVPLIAGVARRLRLPRRALRASTRPCGSPPPIVLVVLGWALARDLGRCVGAGALPPHGPGDRRARSAFLIRLTVPRGRGAARAADRRARPADAGRRRRLHRRRLRSRRPADARQPDRRHGAALRAAVPRRRPRAAAGAAALAGQIEGVVGSLGLLYTTLRARRGPIMVPNNVVLSAAVVPLREPAAVDLRARLRPDVKPERGAGAARGRRPARRCAASRTSRSRRSTATRSWCASRPRRSRAPTARGSPTRSSPRDRRGHARGRRRRERPIARRRAARRAGRRASARLARCPSAIASAIAPEPSRRCSAARAARARARPNAAPSAQAERRDVDLRAVALDRPHDRVGDVLRRPRRRRPGSFTPASRNMPASRMKPGKTVETPTPVPRRSSRSASAKPRSPNFVAE